MTPRERVIASLNHRQPDKVPYCIEFTEIIHAKMAEYYGDPDFASKIGNSMVIGHAVAEDGWKEVAPNIWEDEFGVRWDRHIDKDIGVVCNQQVTPETLDGFAFPDIQDPKRWEPVEQLVANKGDRFVVLNIGFSLFERAWTLYGMENLLEAMIVNPDFVHTLLDRIVENNVARIEHSRKYDIDANFFGDDWGSQRGLIMGPQLWREFIKPRIKRMYDAVHASGRFVFCHSCGKVDELFPELIECGLNCFNPFQPEVIDVFDAKRRYGHELSFYGGISTQRTLPHGTVQQVRDEVRRLIDEVGENGGYIAAPAHATPADARPENVAAMIDVLQNQ